MVPWLHGWKRGWSSRCLQAVSKPKGLWPIVRNQEGRSDGEALHSTSIRSKNLWPPRILQGMPSFCNAFSMGRERALNRTSIEECQKNDTRTSKFSSRSTTKSPHRITPPMLAVHRLISWAINPASSFSSSLSWSTGVAPSGWEVCSDLGIRNLSINKCIS